MDWIQGIQRAIEYVEAHITEDIDFDDVAGQAYSSPFRFQRVLESCADFRSAKNVISPHKRRFADVIKATAERRLCSA